LDSIRLEGRRARSNLEASVDRLDSEPGTSVEQKAILGALLANSHRLAHALMALEAGLSVRRTASPRTALKAFGESVETTLAALSKALHGAPLDQASLPDLREAHHVLLAESDTASPRYTLINVEADRVVNSLNTLAGDVSRWAGAA